ncbi:BrnA antitoxin family protein [Frigidibacter sp. MR17.24]|uniref:BrnA antitoxin family protein n=1 Tax=Frigidibacter sp. MR17.24 TaxID=3127345 RepID=UPI003012D28B
MPRQTKRQRENYHYMADAMRRLEWDLHNAIVTSGKVPLDWHRIAQDRHPKRRVRVTIRVEEDVLRFFRSMSSGHGPLMNEVLRSFMHARLAGVVRGADTLDYYQRREDEGLEGARPDWGADYERLEGMAAGIGIDIADLGFDPGEIDT